ncbi:hypothetical protein RYZ26_15220 [Terasakiella sp. A23]|uniref:hypothetical protein n=1 Tax=Terasakiella sp. FCG-A23 TaxID=3080561 RepID=UPI0029543265|nr:hypothetical protein [Terasakiella sp. A23]MDV7340956.1 hypothetical protein [Terasakiella sp. A23]
MKGTAMSDSKKRRPDLKKKAKDKLIGGAIKKKIFEWAYGKDRYGINGGNIGPLGPSIGTNGPETTGERAIDELRSEGVPEKYLDYNQVVSDADNAIRRGDSPEKAIRYAKQKAKGRWLEQRFRPQRMQSHQSMSSQSVQPGMVTDMRYRGDDAVPSKGKNNPQDVVLPAVMTPTVIAMRKQLEEQLKGSSEDDLQIKHPKDWTQEELLAAMKERERISDPVMKDQMFRREREWFENAYGNQEVEYDETGKMKQPKMRGPVYAHPTPMKTKDGQDLHAGISQIVDQAIGGVGSPIEGINLPFYDEEKGGWVQFDPMTGGYNKVPAGPAQEKGREPHPTDYVKLPYEHMQPGEIDESVPVITKKAPDVVKGIQSGLNMLTNKQNQSPLPGAVKQVKLKEDGVAGPKTSLGLKKALVENGTGKVAEAVAMGQFKEVVKKAKKEGPQNLADELSQTFSPLLPKKKSPKDGFQMEGLALQDTLNDLGAGLKDDGIVGPKTTDAFTQAAKKTDEDDLINRFAYNMGFNF